MVASSGLLEKFYISSIHYYYANPSLNYNEVTQNSRNPNVPAVCLMNRYIYDQLYKPELKPDDCPLMQHSVNPVLLGLEIKSPLLKYMMYEEIYFA
jgi:hypothetical protein